VKTLQAPRTNSTRTAASIPALLLLSALSGTAIAATDIQAPCHDTASEVDNLRTLITTGTESLAPAIRTVEAHDAASPATTVIDAEAVVNETDHANDSDAVSTPDSASPTYTTRLPGVSANDMPGFRRHMFRTDI